LSDLARYLIPVLPRESRDDYPKITLVGDLKITRLDAAQDFINADAIRFRIEQKVRYQRAGLLPALTWPGHE
jgi:hypothetical protein